MKSLNKLITMTLLTSGILSTLSPTYAAYPKKSLSISVMNASLDSCYQQTLKVTKSEQMNNTAENIQLYACNRVLNNSWLPKKTEAITRLNRGLVYLYQGKKAQAISDFKRAIRANPKLQAAHIALAQQLVKQNKFNKALSHYELAIAIDTNNTLNGGVIKGNTPKLAVIEEKENVHKLLASRPIMHVNINERNLND